MNNTEVRVAPGDTLSEIAARHDVSVEELQRWNEIEDPDFLQAGQIIVVRSPMDALIPDLTVGAWSVGMMAVVVLAFLLLFLWKHRSHRPAGSDSSSSIDEEPEAGSRRLGSIWLPPRPASVFRRLQLPTVNAGERLVGRHLDRHYRDWRQFHNLLLPSGRGTTQIDHVLVSPAGVFVIETKDMNGWVFGSPGGKDWTQTFPAGHWSRSFGIKSKRFRFYNPLFQNEGHARALADLGVVERRWIRPIAVFVGDAELKTADEFLPFEEHEKTASWNLAWRMRGVLCMSLEELHRYIAFSANVSSHPGLTRQRMETICSQIEAAAIPLTAESHAKHVDYVQSVKNMAASASARRRRGSDGARRGAWRRGRAGRRWISVYRSCRGLLFGPRG